MTDTPSRRRMTRTERTQHLYTARTDEYTPNEQEPFYRPNEDSEGDAVYRPNELAYEEAVYAPNEAEYEFANETESAYAEYLPNEQPDEYAGYTPNEQPDEYAAYRPNEESAQQPEADYAAYYSRESELQQMPQEPAFAPPPSMQQYAFDPQVKEEEPTAEYGYASNNVYRPRQVTWAEEDREEAIAESELGYQVQEENHPTRRKRRGLRTFLIVLIVLALAAAGLWLLREPLEEMLGITILTAESTETPAAAVATPEPIKAYEAAPAAVMADAARMNIARLSGTLEMENHIITEQHIVTRNRRPDGSYDFYLFSAEGRLLCYFEGLNALDMIPQSFGGFYVRQAPWLVTASGSALIRTADVEAAINEKVFLHPMYHGWAVVESTMDGHANYVNAEGKMLSNLWFSRTFPFTGERTLAYVDTGSTANASDRYLLYVIGTDGSMNRWLAAADMDDVIAAVCDMAYMSDGTLYRLADPSSPVCSTPEITAYLDCDAMVIKDPASGKYGLFVHGEQHYGFVYDAIQPLKSDLEWAEKNMGGASAVLKLKAVSGAQYPQPLSYSFVLEKEGQREYVALSAASSYPILLQDEF